MAWALTTLFSSSSPSIDGMIRFRIYSGTPPATADATASGTLLADCGINGSFPAANETTAVLTCTADGSGRVFYTSSAAATGTAGYWRFTDYSGNGYFQGTIGSSGADVNLNTLSITAGSPVTITAFSMTMTGLNA